MQQKEIEIMFHNAIVLRDRGELKDAIVEFLKIIDKFPYDPKIAGVYTTLGGVCMDLKDYDRASVYLKTATELNPKSELASLCLYLSYIELDRSNQAIDELKRYLDVYPAKLYKDTLEELLEDLGNGYATSFKDIIVQLAKKNGVAI